MNSVATQAHYIWLLLSLAMQLQKFDVLVRFVYFSGSSDSEIIELHLRYYMKQSDSIFLFQFLGSDKFNISGSIHDWLRARVLFSFHFDLVFLKSSSKFS